MRILADSAFVIDYLRGDYVSAVPKRRTEKQP